MYRFCTCLILLFYASAPAGAEDPSPARILMDESGLVEQFGDFDQQIHDQVLESAEKNSLIPPDGAVALAEITRKAMNTERMLADLETVLTDTLSPEQMTEFTAFYRTPLGQRILKLEIAASLPAARAEKIEQSDSILANLNDQPERLAMFRKVDDTLHSTELSTTIVLTFMHTMAIAVAESQERGGSEIHDKIREQISGLRGMLKQSMQNQIMVGFAYTYRDLENEDLVAYMDFLQTPSAQATYAAVSAGMHEVFSSRGYEIGSDFAAFVKQKKI